jgi:hypothetical protein
MEFMRVGTVWQRLGGKSSEGGGVAIHFLYYNFGRIHKTLRVTPAMAAGISDHVWSYEEIAELARLRYESMAGMGHDNIRNHPFLCLALSLIPLSLAIYGTVTGTAVMKSSKVERAKNPIEYWLVLAFEYGLFAWLFITAISS